MNGFSKGTRHSHCPSPPRTLQGQAQLYLNSPAKGRIIHQPQPPYLPQAPGSVPMCRLIPHPTLSPQAPTGTHRRGAGGRRRFGNGVQALLNEAAVLVPISSSAASTTSRTAGKRHREGAIFNQLRPGRVPQHLPALLDHWTQNRHIRRVSTTTLPPC